MRLTVLQLLLARVQITSLFVESDKICPVSLTSGYLLVKPSMRVNYAEIQIDWTYYKLTRAVDKLDEVD